MSFFAELKRRIVFKVSLPELGLRSGRSNHHCQASGHGR